MAKCGGGCLRYKDKVTIVTGGASGIGKGIVKIFAQEGSKVIIADINEAVAKETVRTINETGPGEATFIKCDVTSKDEVMKMVDDVIQTFGQIDCLVNNAGTCLSGKTDNFDIDKVKFMNDLNIVGPFIVSQVCMPYLRKVKGNIVNIASAVGAVGGPQGMLAYAATKEAVKGFTRTLAAEEGPTGVRVNGLAPGPINTELLGTLMKEMPEKMSNFLQHECNVMGRLGEPEEIGRACLFMAADATYCTGAILNCSGGADIDYGIKRGPNHYTGL